MIASDKFDSEASVISSAKKDANGRALPKNQIKGLRDDDTRSMISMQSNISAVSRRSGVSLLDMDSIVSLGAGASGTGKARPGIGGLRDAAERRMQKAQMVRIEAHLTRLQSTDDLSYSARPDQVQESVSQDDQDGRKLIDQVTLYRLIDECREEQD
jgi:hypothetical protein